MTVKNLEKKPDLVFVNDLQDVNFIKEYIGKKAVEFDSFFVNILDGDYSEIYGIFGSIPYLEKEVYKIKGV